MKRFVSMLVFATIGCGSVARTEDSTSSGAVGPQSDKVRCAWITSQYAYYEYDESQATVPPTSIGQGSGVVTWTISDSFKGLSFQANLASQYGKNVPWIILYVAGNETRDVCPTTEKIGDATAIFDLAHDVFSVSISDGAVTQIYTTDHATW